MSFRVWFYNPDKEHTTSYNVINKLVAGLTPPFCHVELQFPGGDACSIVMHDTVRVRKRSFDEDYYTCVAIQSTPAALKSCKALALSHVNSCTAFGLTADHTFCSKLVAELLRDSGVVSADAFSDGVYISPSALYTLLTNSARKKPCVSTGIVPVHFTARIAPQQLRVQARGV